MTAQELIQLAKDKNAARRELVIRRQRAYMPSGTDQMKKVIMDADSASEQEKYDNLCDEYAIGMMFASK